MEERTDIESAWNPTELRIAVMMRMAAVEALMDIADTPSNPTPLTRTIMAMAATDTDTDTDTHNREDSNHDA
jgi:hypothetical protein